MKFMEPYPKECPLAALHAPHVSTEGKLLDWYGYKFFQCAAGHRWQMQGVREAPVPAEFQESS